MNSSYICNQLQFTSQNININKYLESKNNKALLYISFSKLHIIYFLIIIYSDSWLIAFYNIALNNIYDIIS